MFSVKKKKPNLNPKQQNRAATKYYEIYYEGQLQHQPLPNTPAEIESRSAFSKRVVKKLRSLLMSEFLRGKDAKQWNCRQSRNKPKMIRTLIGNTKELFLKKDTDESLLKVLRQRESLQDREYKLPVNRLCFLSHHNILHEAIVGIVHYRMNIHGVY